MPARRNPGGDLAARAEQAIASLLSQSHLLPPDAIEKVFAEAVRPLGISEVRVYLADLQQQQLESLPRYDGPGPKTGRATTGTAKGMTEPPETLAIDSTIAGYAFGRLRSSTFRPTGAAKVTGCGFRWSTAPSGWAC